MWMVNSMTDLSKWSTTCVCFFWTSPPFYQARAVFSREKDLSRQSHRYNINFFKMFGQTSLTSWGRHDKKKKKETMDKGSERGERNLAQEQGEERKPPCGWRWILLPRNFPLSKHFTYHYVNLIKRRGWVKVLCRNAAQCVYVLRLLWSKWNT